MTPSEENEDDGEAFFAAKARSMLQDSSGSSLRGAISQFQENQAKKENRNTKPQTRYIIIITHTRTSQRKGRDLRRGREGGKGAFIDCVFESAPFPFHLPLALGGPAHCVGERERRL